MYLRVDKICPRAGYPAGNIDGVARETADSGGRGRERQRVEGRGSEKLMEKDRERERESVKAEKKIAGKSGVSIGRA